MEAKRDNISNEYSGGKVVAEGQRKLAVAKIRTPI